MLWLPEEVDAAFPELVFRERSTDDARPVVVLDERGLFRDGEPICSWPEGTYSREQRANMVLLSGPATVKLELLLQGKLGKGRDCDGGPIKSIWGDEGLGAAVLFVEVESREGKWLRVSHDQRNLFLDWKGIPAPGAQWRESKNAFEARQLAEVEALLLDSSFRRFLGDTSNCLDAGDPVCFAKYLTPRIYIGSFGYEYPCDHSDRWYATAQSYAECVFSEAGRQYLREFRACFARRSYPGLRPGVLEGVTGECRFERSGGDWTVELLGPGE